MLSGSNEAHDRVRKRRIYAEQGVPHYWIVNPEARTLEAFVLEGSRWSTRVLRRSRDGAHRAFRVGRAPGGATLLPKRPAFPTSPTCGIDTSACPVAAPWKWNVCADPVGVSTEYNIPTKRTDVDEITGSA